MQDIIFDCTELRNNPVRTGIQRVVREMLRHWPKDGPNLHPAFFDGTTLVGLPEQAVQMLREDDRDIARLAPDEVAKLVGSCSLQAPPLPDASVLIPEVFFDGERARFHAARARSGRMLAMLAYDFLPFLRPDLFRLRSAAPLMGYIQAILAAGSVASISEATAQEYRERIMRDPTVDAGPVLPLGADGLGLERQQWHPRRTGYVAIGSLDGRKSQDVIVEAFANLWDAGHDMELVLIGRLFAHVERDWLDRARRYRHFRWIENASDDTVAVELAKARATVYASTAEGFGLPPIESLAAGVPVIASRSLPSVAGLPELGRIDLLTVSAASIAQAVLAMEADATAARLWTEAASVRLPKWEEFGASAAAWIDRLG